MDLTDYNISTKSGSEALSFNGNPLPYTLLDFWRWSVSDILSNATRGILGGFIVATALGADTSKPREEWDAFDLITKDGVKIEVKSCAYLQSWQQVKYSEIKFGTKPAKAWDTEIEKRSKESKRNADVYLFCLPKHQENRASIH